MLTSPFAEKTTETAELPGARPVPMPSPEAPPASQPTPEKPKTPALPRARRSVLEVLEARMPGVSSARLPTVADVRAYHRAHQYVRSEAEWRIWLAVIYGWGAVAWCAACTLIAWAGAGDYRRRLGQLWQGGVPGLFRAQLPPLGSLTGFPLFWVAAWSAIAWTGLKFWRPVMVLTYVLAAVLPILL